MTTAYLTVGVPASGKSTWALATGKQFGYPVVCRDDVRIMQGLTHGENEELVSTVEYALIEGLILEGKNFIVADTNINKKFRNKLIKFLHRHGVDVELILFPISLDEAILRDANREAKVGADVIQRMDNDLSGQWKELCDNQILPAQEYDKYEHGTGDNYRPDGIVIDIDGTLARHWNRSPYDYSKVGDDLPIQDVCDVVSILAQFYTPIFVSGREDSCREDTAQWIEKHTGIAIGANSPLHMRKSKDQRPDWIVKNEIYDAEVIPKYNIVMVFDDRDQVVHHLRRRGITVAQVAPGRF